MTSTVQSNFSGLLMAVDDVVTILFVYSTFQAWRLQGFNVARENQQSDAAEKKSPFFNSFQTANIDI